MKVHRLERVQRLAIPLERAWGFFSDPRNLREITPASLDFRIVGDLPDRMYAGLIIRYRIRPLFGISVSWVTEITHLDEGRMFVDEQRLGPYRFWHHQHHFRAVEGGVEVTDLVHYAPPAPAAALANRLLVGPRLREIFDHRQRVLAERFGELH